MDVAALTLEDAVDLGETEPGAGALVLRGEEGLEDTREVFARDAVAGVCDLDDDPSLERLRGRIRAQP